MYFKRLEMHGFKSFAEPVIIEFHEGVTCIVGPNGSGKSNISDAIRWVLGEQSPKALRGGKMEEVIFAGTASRKSRGMAEVTLVIDNSTGILDIDYNEVAITRRMYRSGESEYLINNNQCRLRDIRELIMDTGIGVDGYSLIGQGKIADIVSNKPESRREIFEEAAGVVMYKSKKAEAERKLDSTANNLERVDDIIGEIEGRIDGLREDSAKAKEYLELKERYRDLEINITLKNIENILNKDQVFKNDIQALQEQIEVISREKREIDVQAQADRERSDTLDHLGNDARDKLLNTVEEINRKTSDHQLREERLSGIRKDENRLQQECEVLRERCGKEEHNQTELEKSRSEILRKYEEAETLLQEKILYHSQVSREASLQAEQIDNGKELLFGLHNEIAVKSSEVKSYASMKDTLEKRSAQLSQEAEASSAHSNENNRILSETRAQEASLQEEIKGLEKQLNTYIAESRQLTEERKTLNALSAELRLKGSQKAARKKTIEEMESNYEGYNFAVKYIMRANLPGIKGVVADLMEVPKGYETAVETALGAQMQNIICDTDGNAKNAVNALKENKAGRLTFLPIASIKGNRAAISSRISGHKGYIGLAADCIKSSQELSQIFDYLLGRVIIVKDMDTAISLSKEAGGGIRLVTLDGEIINASGAITGGRYKNKTANLLERKGEIASLDQEINRISAQLSDSEGKSKATANRLERVEQQISTLRETAREKEILLAALKSKITALVETLEGITDRSQRYDSELSAIEREMHAAEAAQAQLQSQIKEAQERIGQVNEEIEAAMTAYEEQKRLTDQASEEITKTRIDVNGWSSKKTNMEELRQRVEEAIEDYHFQIQEKERTLHSLTEEKNSLLFGEVTEADIEELVKTKEETEGYIGEITREKEALSQRLGQVTAQQQALGEKINACQDQKYQLEIKLAKSETQLDTYKERLWDEFEISYAQAVDLRKEDFVMGTSIKESREIRNRIRELGEVNVGAIKEYESVSQRYTFLTTQRTDIVTAMDELKAIITDMDTTIKTKFKENFDQVVENFETIFRELFGGGHAELSMEDENNPLESGIDIIAQPPGKKLQNINLMSGGEKTMTAIALLFAVLKTKPTPFCILDEVEAALDDANIDRFSRYLRKFENIQFTLVTHQKATMEHADVLYGVTMPEQGISKVLSLRLGDNFEL